jgi:hypothetical protein
MSVDYRWQSQGGILLDGDGDIAYTSDPLETVVDLVNTRLDAAVDAYKLYRIGAGLTEALGVANDGEEELEIRRRVVSALTVDFQPACSFDVQTLALGEEIVVSIFLGDQFIATTSISTSSQVNA